MNAEDDMQEPGDRGSMKASHRVEKTGMGHPYLDMGIPPGLIGPFPEDGEMRTRNPDDASGSRFLNHGLRACLNKSKWLTTKKLIELC
jgi:hypothetical protein